MNKIGINLKISDNKNLIYKIYRSTKQEDLPASLDALKDLQPIMEINEAVIPATTFNISEEMARDYTSSDTNMIKYKLNNIPVKSDNEGIFIFFQYPAKNADIPQRETLKLIFDKDGNVIQVIHTDKENNTENLSDIASVIIIDGDIINIAKQYIENTISVVAYYYINVISVCDGQYDIAGVTYYGPEPTGLPKPELSISYNIIPTTNDVSLPYVHLAATNDLVGLMYYYRVVAINPDNQVSSPSSLSAIELNHNTELIKNYIEVSKDYNYSTNPAWTPLAIASSSDIVDIGKIGALSFGKYGNPVNDAVPVFNAEDAIIDKRYVNSDNVLILNIPNVWRLNDEKYNKRYYNAYRYTFESNSHFSKPSTPVTYKEKAEIPIEKMIIIKRVVTGKDNGEQTRASAPDEGSIIKTIIRKAGIYYDKVNYTALPINIPNSKFAMDLITPSSLFEKFNIEDDCMAGEIYNYTIYLYDAYSTQSGPIVIKVEV